MADKTIDWFQKSAFEEVRVTIGDFKGKTRANVRIYADYNGEDEYSPTKKGISVELKDVPRLKKAVDALAEAVANLGEEEE